MTFFELVLSLLVISAMLGAACRVTGMLREDNSEIYTRGILRTLQESLQTYHARHNAWPAAPTPVAISTLVNDSATQAAMRTIEPTRDADGKWVVVDGFGNPVRYLLPKPGSSAEPDFVSAGRDGQFGFLETPTNEIDTHMADNLYGVDQNTYTAISESTDP